MNSSVTFTPDDVSRIAALANIPIPDEEKQELAKGFTSVIQVVDQLEHAQTGGVEPTHQVTGLFNVMRDDEVDDARTFSQEDALRNAKRSHNGYFLVKQILRK